MKPTPADVRVIAELSADLHRPDGPDEGRDEARLSGNRQALPGRPFDTGTLDRMDTSTRLEHAEREVERLRALLREVASSGVPLRADSGYVEALIDRDTWLQLQHSAFAV